MRGSIKQLFEELSESKKKIEEYSRTLEQKVDERTRDLISAQKGLIEAAHTAGMAEIATVVTRMQENDVLLTIAGNEPSVDAGYAVQIAKEKGLRTVTVGGSGVILPARESELTVIVPCDSPASVMAFGTLMQVLSLIWEAVITEQVESDDARKEELHKTMEELLRKRANTPEYEVASLQDLWSTYVS